MTTETRRDFSTFDEMFHALKVSAANRIFIAHAFERVAVSAIVETKSYVKVVRSSGVDMRIYRGIISGYSSEEEATALTGAPHATLSKSRPGYWWVNLPDRTEADVPTRSRLKADRPSWLRTPCPECRYLMNEHRVCTNCA